MKKILSTILFLFLILSTTSIGQELLGEFDWTYYDLPNGEKAISVIYGDDLQFPVGSASLNDPLITENWNRTQMTIQIGIEALYFVPEDGLSHYFFENRGSGVSQNTIYCRINEYGMLQFVTYDKDTTTHRVDYDVTSWTIGERHQIVAVLDYKNDVMALYVDGSLEDDTGHNLSSDSIDTVESSTHFGSNAIVANQLNGSGTIQVWDIVQDAAWVTAQWNGGDVSFVVDPDTILMARFSEDNTGIVYHHSGKLVSSIVAGGTEATFVSAAGSDIIKDGDALLVQDGTGYSKPFFADGDWSDTGGDGDDGAGGAVVDIEKVGLYAELNGSTEYFSRSDTDFSESGILGDMTIQLWIKLNTISGLDAIIGKYLSAGDKRMYIFYRNANELRLLISPDGTLGAAKSRQSTNADMVTGVWYHVAVTYNAAGGSCIFYKNGVALTDNGVALPNNIADKDPEFTIGTTGNHSEWFHGSVFNAALFDDKRTPAEILASATDSRLDVSGDANCIGQWMFDDDAAATQIDNLEGDAGKDLNLVGGDTTNYGTHTRTQAAHVSKILISDGDMENGGIGGIANIATTWTITKDSASFKDSLALKAVNAAGNDGDEFTIWSPTLVTNEKYWQKLWVFPSAIHDDSKLYLDIDGAATPILSREIGKSLGDNGHFARDFNLDATYYAQAANNGVHDIGLQDIGLWAWVKVNSDAVGTAFILSKNQANPYNGYSLAYDGAGKLYGRIDDGADRYTISGVTDIRDDTWHCVVCIFDRNNTANCKIYLDGEDDGTTDSEILADVNSITSTALLTLGAWAWDLSNEFDGYIAEFGIAYPADIMAAGEMGDAGEIANLYNNPGDPSQWPNHEDHWLCNDNTNDTVVTGAVNNLIASANTDVFAEEHWKRYDICYKADQTDITCKLRATGAGVGANAVTVLVDDAELRVNMVANGGCEGGADPPTSWTQEGSATVISDTSPHSGTNCLKATAGAANVGASQNITLVDGKLYTVTIYARATEGDTAALVVDTGDSTIVTLDTTTSTTWTMLQGTFVATGTSGVLYVRGVANGDIVWFDDGSMLLNDEADASTDLKGEGFWPLYPNPLWIPR